MHREKTGKKAKAASEKAIIASVTKEMAQLRLAESAQGISKKEIRARDKERM
jgi:hypothetical protein